MYWALTTDLVDTRGFRFEQVLADIQTLNNWARAARLEVTAISLAAYPFVQEDYALLPHGASIGSGYGPIVVARTSIGLNDLRGLEIVVPGAMTTAFLTLRLVLGDFAYRELPFEQIPAEVASGRADAGLLIHEGQLTFSELGLDRVLDLGEWWLLETGLPLPLGVNVARRDIERLRDLSAVLRDAIACGLDHRAEALDYALQFGRGIDAAVADRFVSMYVNELTQDYGDEAVPRSPSSCGAARRSAPFPSPSPSTGSDPSARSLGERLDGGVGLAPDDDRHGREHDRCAEGDPPGDGLVEEEHPECDGYHRVDVGVGRDGPQRNVVQQPDVRGEGDQRAEDDEVGERGE